MTTQTATDRRGLAAAWDFLATWWQQIAITQAGVYLVASFGKSHGILPEPAAWVLAIGMEGTYLKGLIDAGHVQGKAQRWAAALIVGTYLTVICWGIAYILSLPAVGVIPERELGRGWGAFIALIHVLPISFTGLCSAMLHRARAAQDAAARARDAAAERERATLLQERLDAEAAEERAARRQIAIEAERKRAELDVWAATAERKAQLRAHFANTVRDDAANTANTASGTATNSPANRAANSEDEQRRAQVVAALTDNPKANRSQLARDLGIGRTKLYELIRDAQDRGELPKEG